MPRPPMLSCSSPGVHPKYFLCLVSYVNLSEFAYFRHGGWSSHIVSNVWVGFVIRHINWNLLASLCCDHRNVVCGCACL
jgi:hypothetical protein